MGDMTGSAAYITFKGTVITPDFREWEDGGEMGLVDASAGADTVKTYLTTLSDGTAKFTGLYQGGTAATDVYNLVAVGANGTLIVGIEGTAAGKPKKTINSAFVKSRSRKAPYDDVVELSVEFQFSAAETDGTF
jgi:hypothetical protein